jgi:hypothetical protein
MGVKRYGLSSHAGFTFIYSVFFWTVSMKVKGTVHSKNERFFIERTSFILSKNRTCTTSKGARTKKKLHQAIALNRHSAAPLDFVAPMVIFSMGIEWFGFLLVEKG